MKKAGFVIKHFFEDGWSLDVCANRSLATGEFSHYQTVCTRTLYNYVDQGLMTIKNYDLPEKLKRNTKLHHLCSYVRELNRIPNDRIHYVY
ncbi:hypothetical protein LBHL_12420 [Lactobacillus helveticus]|nr:hypothetical protein LBHL_12420 [Lactobacillus helveticus]GFP14616.1 hypothetical protein LHEJCM1120_02450 [Lactobacillus helveticus]